MNMVPAWIISAPGAPDVLQAGYIRLPELAAGEVLIRVVAAGFNPIDTKIRSGLAPIMTESGVSGVDVSGVVEQIGADVTHIRPGDAVYGCAGGVRGHCGALAQYMIADARLLARVPDNINLEQAAGLPVAALTALALQRRLAFSAGDEVCVLGASGAVGQMTTKLARLAGCRVVGSAGTADRLKSVRAAGAQAFLHHEIGLQNRSFAKIVDTFGGPALQQALQLAQAGGQVATINARGQHDLGLAHGKSLTLHAIFILLPLLSGSGRELLGADLDWLARQIEAGLIQPLDVQTRPMSAIVDVHRQYESGQLQQKTVLLADF